MSVINTATNTATATVTVGTEPYDLAITPNGAYAYVTNYDDTVSVINVSTSSATSTPTPKPYQAANTVVAEVPRVSIQSWPECVAITPNDEYSYVTDSANDAVFVIKAATSNADISSPSAIVTPSSSVLASSTPSATGTSSTDSGFSAQSLTIVVVAIIVIVFFVFFIAKRRKKSKSKTPPTR